VIRDANPREYVRGQYDGYREVEGVKPESDTETFAALGLHIDSWRWSGVPFLIRAGKALRSTGTEVRIVFRQPPPIVQPLLEDPPPVERHPVGSWGPTGAERLAEKHGGWKPPAGGLTGERWAAGGWSG
jgi:glucose-6-phosphate 1-dehydrogenase